MFRKNHPAVIFGANEHAYSYRGHKKAFRAAGIRKIKIVPRGFECDFGAISQKNVRNFIRFVSKIPFIGEGIARFIILNFSGAGAEITIYGYKHYTL